MGRRVIVCGVSPGVGEGVQLRSGNGSAVSQVFHDYHKDVRMFWPRRGSRGSGRMDRSRFRTRC